MADLIAPLRAHAPFDELEAAALDFLGRHLELAYYPRGQLVIGPESGAVRLGAHLARRTGWRLSVFRSKRATTHWATRSPQHSYC